MKLRNLGVIYKMSDYLEIIKKYLLSIKSNMILISRIFKKIFKL